MEDIRCTCGKILLQADGETVIIKCRHCKRYILIRTSGNTAGKGPNRKDSNPIQYINNPEVLSL